MRLIGTDCFVEKAVERVTDIAPSFDVQVTHSDAPDEIKRYLNGEIACIEELHAEPRGFVKRHTICMAVSPLRRVAAY